MKFQLVDGIFSKGLLSVDISTIDLPADINDDEIIVIGASSAPSSNNAWKANDSFVNTDFYVVGHTLHPNIRRLLKKPLFESLLETQAERFRSGKELRCSTGLAAKIKRKALDQDMGV